MYFEKGMASSSVRRADSARFTDYTTCHRMSQDNGSVMGGPMRSEPNDWFTRGRLSRIATVLPRYRASRQIGALTIRRYRSSGRRDRDPAPLLHTSFVAALST